jgi:hypothetical protein
MYPRCRSTSALYGQMVPVIYAPEAERDVFLRSLCPFVAIPFLWLGVFV